jgi:hypothetical protein
VSELIRWSVNPRLALSLSRVVRAIIALAHAIVIDAFNFTVPERVAAGGSTGCRTPCRRFVVVLFTHD